MTDENHIPFTQAFGHPPADNDNKHLLPGWCTPWRGLALCRRAMQELLAEHRRSGVLVRDRKARARLADMRAYEACLRWHYFRKR